MGHLGLTPQSIYKFGTYTVRAKEEEEAAKLVADAKMLEEFKRKAAENLAIDGGGHLTYLASSNVNLSLTEERWPDIRFRSTREH